VISICQFRKSGQFKVRTQESNKRSDCSPAGSAKENVGHSVVQIRQNRRPATRIFKLKKRTVLGSHRLHKNYCIESVSWGYVRSSELTENEKFAPKAASGRSRRMFAGVTFLAGVFRFGSLTKCFPEGAACSRKCLSGHRCSETRECPRAAPPWPGCSRAASPGSAVPFFHS
jgi:hypothetical protein